MADVVDRANDELENQQAAIGPSCFMREMIDDETVGLNWGHNVLPHIEDVCTDSTSV